MPRTEVANERLRQEARARILAGARAAFARKGLAATMTDVATAAGVSQGLPYRYFGDKDELIRALLTEAVGHAEGEPAQPAVPGSAASRLHALITGLVEARRAQPEMFLLLQHVAADPATPVDLLDLILARGRRVAETMRRLIIQAQSAGEIAPDDPDQLLTAVMACLDGLGRFALAYPGQAADHFPAAEIIIRMLATDRPPRAGRGKRTSAREPARQLPETS